MGVIIRDDKGRVEAAMSTKIYAPLVVVEVEAKTFEVGLLYAKDVGIWVCMLFVKIFGDKIIE